MNPAPVRIAAEDQELVTFAQARKILGGISAGDFANLIAQGHLRPHPILTDRINHEQVRQFARICGAGAEADERRPVSNAASKICSEGQIWSVPTFGKVG